MPHLRHVATLSLLVSVLALGGGPGLAAQQPQQQAPHGQQVRQGGPTQGGSTQGTSTQGGSSQGGSAHADAGSDASDDQADDVPVFAVTGVEVVRSRIKPGFDLVVVSGVASNDHWSGGELVPLTRGEPSDHVLNLVLVGQPPGESAAPSGYSPVHAVMPLPAGHPFQAIRVRSATNSVLLKELPGATEVAAPADPCKQCLGRVFVGKGETAPAGVPPDRLLRQEDLPPNARVIRPNDGIADVQRNPNRLTILVGDDGHVVDAVWE